MSKQVNGVSNSLRVGYVSQGSDDFCVVKKLFEHDNEVAFASLDDALSRVWRSYQPGVAVADMLVQPGGLFDVLVFDWSVNDASAAYEVSQRHTEARSVYLSQLVNELSMHPSPTKNLVTAIEYFVRSPHSKLTN